MASLSSINIIFNVDLKSLSTDLQNAVRDVKKWGTAMQDVGKDLSMYVTAPILGLGAASVKSYADLEKLQKGLDSVMGDSKKAAVEFEKLKEVAKLPGLGLEEAVRGSVNLQAAGFSADQAREALLAFGNALATVGKGKRELDLVTFALTQLNNKSGGFGQDLRQLTEQLPQLRGAMLAAFGTSDTEKISKSGLTGRQVVDGLVKEFAKLPKVTGGINNAFENLSDNVKISLAQIGKSLNESLNIEGWVNSLSSSLLGLADAFSGLDPMIQGFIIAAVASAAAIGPLVYVIGSAAKAYANFAQVAYQVAAALAANPYTAIAVALGAIAAVTLVATTRFTPLTNAAKEFEYVMKSGAESIAKETAELHKNIAIAKDKLSSDEQKKRAIEALNALSPEYLGNLTLEEVLTGKAESAINKYTEALKRRAQMQAAQEKLVDVERKLLDLQMKGLEQVKPDLWQHFSNAVMSYGSAARFASMETLSMAENFVIENRELTALRDKLLGFVSDNEEVTTVSKNSEAGIQAQIDALKKLQSQVDLNSAAWKDYQKQIESLEKLLTKSDLVKGTIDFYQSQIDAIQKVQNGVATTNKEYAALGVQIDKIQAKIDKIKGVRPDLQSVLPEQGLKPMEAIINTDSSGLIPFQKTISGFAHVSETEIDSLMNKWKEMQETAQAVAGAVGDAFAGFSNRFVESLGLANEGMQGFLSGMIKTVIELISIMLAQSISQAIAGATASGTATGPAAVVATPAFIGAAVSGVLAAFAAIPKFEDGGIVGGHSYFGDKLLARVNSGETIFNQDQQRNLWNMIDKPMTYSDFENGAIVGKTTIKGEDIEVVLERVKKNNNRKK